ncbi:MAG: hypothetical protein KDD94_02955 [Calditrichaeota bacterium]|nr:hypothetical protein [Calditrichota bacterium]
MLVFIILIAFSLQNHDPMKARLVTSDIDHFWQAYENKADMKSTLETIYFGQASVGLKSFISQRISSVDQLLKTINYRPRYYQELKKSTDRLQSMDKKIRSSLIALAYLYPQAEFPDVYFLIGRMNSGGTTSDDGLLIGVDMYGLTDGTDRGELDSWLNSVLKPIDDLPAIVAHELIHFQQQFSTGKNLLKLAIKEGSGDFIGELISGSQINQHVHDYANPREKELWLEFQQDMNGENYQKWMFNGTNAKDKPADLGYWMGYKIVESYYNNQQDKRQAIHDILNITDFDEFLAKSKYEDKFK